jgi:hypothetical protein
MLSLKDFKCLTLEDKKTFDYYYSLTPPFHSGLLFTTMISWSHYVGYYYTIYDDVLIIMTDFKGEKQIRAPVGAYSAEVYNLVVKLAYEVCGDKPLGFISKEIKEWMSRNIPGLSYKEERDLFDYVYRSYDLANLPGSAYAKIRNRLNKFKKKYNYSIERITEDNMKEVREFLRRWCIWRDCSSDELLENERKAVIYSMDHFFYLGLSGLALRINGNVEAVSVFERLNNDTAVIHYEKGSPDYDGVYKAINMETARYLQDEFPFIDREEDLGVPGLRQAKLSYNPHHFIEVYSTSR